MTIHNKIGDYLTPGRAWYNRATSSIKKLTVHHDAIPHDNRSAEQVLNQIRDIHTSKGWPGASYHFYIHTDGEIYQLNELKWVTWHDSHNWDSIGIVLHGYFHPNFNNQPTKEQLRSLKALLHNLCTQHPEFPAAFADVYGHRERSSTACPGNNLYPLVKEYREKLGNVSWGEPEPPQLTPEEIVERTREIVYGGDDDVIKVIKIRELIPNN